jgi:hypothetical protein
MTGIDGLELITLGFGGKILRFQTDVDEVAQFVLRSHRAMVLHDAVEPDRTMTVLRKDTGFVFDDDFFEDVSSPAFLFDLILLRLATAFVELRSDLIWLHSAVAARDGRGVLIVGPSGSGKSTLVTHLCETGWMFLSDEMAPVDMQTRTVLPYPRTPMRRINPGHHMELDQVLLLEREQCSIPDQDVSTRDVPISGIVFPKFEHGATAQLRTVSQGEASLELLRCCNNFPQHKGSAVEALGFLVSTVPCRAVTYGSGREAAMLLHEVVDSRPHR